jgi:hypothetical protein
MPIGAYALGYLDQAMALFNDGEQGHFVVNEDIVIKIDNEDIFIIDLSDNFYFIYPNGAFIRNDPNMIALIGKNTGGFRSDGDNELSRFPDLPRTVAPLTPEEGGYAVPWFTVIPPGELVSLHTGYFSLWKFGAGDSGPYYTTGFYTPVTGTGSQWRIFNATVGLTDYGYNWLFFFYQIGTSIIGDVNDNVVQAKICAYDATSNFYEVDYSAPPIVVQRNMIIAGMFIRRFTEYDADGTKLKNTFIYQHSDVASGTLVQMTESDIGFSFTGVPLPPLPVRARVGYHYTDSMYDIFTSRESKFYYVVQFDSDLDVQPQGLSYPSNIGFYPGTALTVYKMNKSDWSLVDTYHLTPSVIDTNLFGMSPTSQVANCDGGTSFSFASPTRLSRFVPVGIQTNIFSASGTISGQTPQSCGTVIVDANGNEYPLFPVSLVTQDYLYNSNVAVGSVDRAAYLAGGGHESLGWGTLSQPCLLLLGFAGSGDYNWTGVDACGLEISSAADGLLNDTKISEMYNWLREPLGDGTTMLHQLSPRPMDDIVFAWVQTNPSNPDGLRYANQPCYVVCRKVASIIAGDVFTLDLDDILGVQEHYQYVAVGGESEADIIHAFEVLVVGSTVFDFIATAAPYGLSGTFAIVNVPSSGYVDVRCQMKRPSWSRSRNQRILKATVTDGLVKVSLDRVFHDAFTPYWYEF